MQSGVSVEGDSASSSTVNWGGTPGAPSSRDGSWRSQQRSLQWVQLRLFSLLPVQEWKFHVLFK